ncbi:nudix-type nucleoside diphosphatase, YffH/AdpP family [Monaibacterium marinum]|uniref:ADP-ribose pyrophosphatase n=2 Tax=Pontivivens marinum TaxID=1690039 RepID=A0A2C9CVN9_9RHOB|nr:nudix-type nucleoside diphosphatase, YffH/AdpP family [Monaibacterium marinum]
MARDLFFYGTLRDAETLSIVMGPYSDVVDSVDATLADHAVLAVVGEDYPVIVAQAGDTAHGMLVSNLPQGAVDRLSYFEDEFDYALEIRTVNTPDGPRDAEVFFVRGDRFKTGDAWDFEAWSRDNQVAFSECARELMSLFGQVPDEDVDRIWPGIRFRAYARARARLEEPVVVHRSGLCRADVEVEQISRPYVDYFAVEDLRLSHRTFGGEMQGPMDRAVFVSGDAVAVLPWDPKTDSVLLVEQMRVAPLARGAEVPWLLEPIAGRIDSVETAEQTARREAQEEAGLTLGRLDTLPPFYSSPGCLTEQMSCYIGEVDLSQAGGVHGLAAENEDIRSIILTVAELRDALSSGEIENGPLIILAQHLLIHHDRLRADWG